MRILLALAVLICPPVFAYDFRADPPKGAKAAEKSAAIMLEAVPEAPAAREPRSITIAFSGADTMLSALDVEAIEKFARAAAGDITLIAFHSGDSEPAFARAQAVRKAIIAAGTDPSRVLVVPVKDSARGASVEARE